MSFDTQILKSGQGVSLGATIIRDGGLVGMPTETVYGLGANALNEEAVKSIFVAKGRPQDNPLIVHISSVDMLDELVYDDGLARRLFETFSPGPLTIVMKKKDIIPNVVSAGLDTVGIRIPAHKDARDLISQSGCPIAAPSANISGRPSPTTAQAVYEDMAGKIPLIIDGGECAIGIESTVLSIVDKPIILRPGAITPKMLEEYLGEVGVHRGEVSIATSPGMKYRHYAPKCDMYLSSSIEETKCLYDRYISIGKRPIVLALAENVDSYIGMQYLNLGDTMDKVMHNVFEYIRVAEKVADVIICDSVEETGIGASIMNRLKKAASKYEDK
ncbi:MAG: threonylcarbamoyl-AMP synthase [Clostridia bacterium]|nr:threonylcarbamoyl-AMP synthase [Clostridia bacterium]